jgi:ribosome-associated heat shock protein Hsp15
MSKIRVDKWLWSIRIFKSRTLATDACKGGKVKIGGVSVKPSYQIAAGEVVVVKKNGFNFEFRANTLIEKRVGAAIAVTCYEDVTPEAEKTKYAEWFLNASPTGEKRERGTGRPTKKERRDIDEVKDGGDAFDWDDDE